MGQVALLTRNRGLSVKDCVEVDDIVAQLNSAKPGQTIFVSSWPLPMVEVLPGREWFEPIEDEE